MSEALIYKTSNPAALNWWDSIQNANKRVMEEREAYTKKLVEKYGVVGKRYQYSGENIDDRPLMRNSQNIVTGVLCRDGEQPPKGDGWRLDADTGFWKPDLRTKAGKERQAELDELRGIDIRDAAKQIGVIGTAMAESFDRMYFPGFRIDRENGALYVTWGDRGCAKDFEQFAKRTPEIEWVEVPRSEWFAFVERQEAKAQAA